MGKEGPYLLIWVLVLLLLMIAFVGLEEFLLGDIEEQLNGL